MSQSVCKYDLCEFPIEGFKHNTLKYYTNVKRKTGKRALLCPNQINNIQGKTFKNVKKTKKIYNMKDLNKWCNIKNQVHVNPSRITKTIYILWLQGFEQAPEIVKICVKTWEKHNKDWKIIKLDKDNLQNFVNIDNYLSKEQIKHMKVSHYADIIRLLLLKNNGGFWVDATTYCVKPLNDWIYDYVSEGFFVFERDGYGPSRCVGNWFIYSEKNNYIINKWLESSLKFWENKNYENYYHWQPLMFYNLYKTDKTFKEKWDKVKKASAIGPFGPLALNRGKSGGTLRKDIDVNKIYNIRHAMAPFYKLTWKKLEKATDNSVINYFLEKGAFQTGTKSKKEWEELYRKL